MTKTGLKKIDSDGCEPAESKGIELVPIVRHHGEKLKHDFAMANRFLDLLTGGTKESVTFQTFSDCKNKQRPQILHAKPNEKTFNRLQKINQKGSGIFVMVNKGDGKGRAKKNVIGVRSFIIDLDGADPQPAIKALKPHIIVESSPGHFHLYWLVDDCALEQFKPLHQVLVRKFNSDKSCVDLPRVLRVPGFYHLKKNPVLSQLREANDFPRYSTQQVIDGLGLVVDESAAAKQPPRTPQTATAAPMSKGHEYIDKGGEVFNLTTWAARNQAFDIVGSVNPAFKHGEIKPDGKQHVVCPCAHEHTDPDADLATYIANANPPQYPSWEIHCMHAHCAGRDRLAFLAAMLDKGMLSPEILQIPALQMRKPPYANYPAQVIAETLQLRKLEPDELRILLHIMHLSFCEDGTLPNDDWTLARSLGVNETTWQTYRNTLTKTGWLTIADDRLFSPIFRQEFVKAQSALMNKIKGGSTGGKKAAANKASIP